MDISHPTAADIAPRYHVCRYRVVILFVVTASVVTIITLLLPCLSLPYRVVITLLLTCLTMSVVCYRICHYHVCQCRVVTTSVVTIPLPCVSLPSRYHVCRYHPVTISVLTIPLPCLSLPSRYRVVFLLCYYLVVDRTPCATCVTPPEAPQRTQRAAAGPGPVAAPGKDPRHRSVGTTPCEDAAAADDTAPGARRRNRSNVCGGGHTNGAGRRDRSNKWSRAARHVEQTEQLQTTRRLEPDGETGQMCAAEVKRMERRGETGQTD